MQFNETAPTWYTVAAEVPARNATLQTHPVENATSHQQRNQAALVQKYRTQADQLYRQEVQRFNTKAHHDKDANWMQATMSKGTLKDRIAAMSVTVSTDPFHRFSALDGLLQMAGCLSSQSSPNSRVAQLAGEAVVDLFLSTLLPKKRKLLTLAQRPLHLYEKDTNNNNSNKKKATQQTLSPRILLLWRFEEMVREKYHLFITKYFGFMLREGNDLQKIPSLRVAAELLKAVPEGEAELLTLIVNKLGDPNKKVASAAAHNLRSVLTAHPAMQVVVAREVQQLVHRPHLSERALYNCVTFLNQLGLRAETETYRLPSSLVQTYFRLFEVAVRVDDKKKKAKSDEAVAMKGRLLSALLTGVNRARPYLLQSLAELEDHVNSLYRVVHKSQPSACTQALMLLFHSTIGTVLEEKQSTPRPLTDVEKSHQKRFYVSLYSKLAQTVMIGSGKHLTMFFNLLYKSMKYDTDKNRVLAFAKRLMCTALHCSSAVVSASLFLLNEIGKVHPEVLDCHRTVLEGKEAQRVYDMREQDPSKAIQLSSSGEESGQSDTRLAPSWEMCLAMHHYHPTVNAFAKNFGQISYNGDPLVDFTLGQFLDKFAYRNPKSSEKVAGKFSRGNSVAERRSGNERRIEEQFALPFNDPTFLHTQDVDVADQFFHQYFVERAKRDSLNGISRKKTELKGSEDDEEESENEDDALDALDAAEGQVTDFGKYEAMWETDEEEEAFVDSLAQKIIEDSMDANELGPDDLDDEDPDMDDWDDMYADDNANNEQDAEEFDGFEKEELLDSDSDEEGLKQPDSSDEEDTTGKTALAQLEGDEDAFMDDLDSEDDSDMEESDDNAFVEEVDEDEEDAMGWLNEDVSDEEKEESVSTGKANKNLPTFASLEDYEERINKSFGKMKRRSTDDDDDDNNNNKETEVPTEQTASKKKKKKRRKK